MSCSKLNCQDYVDCILNGGIEAERCSICFYKQYFGFIYRISRQYRISHEEAVSLYGYAIAVLNDRIRRGLFSCNTDRSHSNFVFQVMVNRSISANGRNEVSTIDIEDDGLRDILISTNVDGGDSYENIQLVRHCLDEIGERCKNVLLDWICGYSMADIAERNGFANANVAAVTRLNCFKRFKECIEKNYPV